MALISHDSLIVMIKLNEVGGFLSFTTVRLYFTSLVCLTKTSPLLHFSTPLIFPCVFPCSFVTFFSLLPMFCLFFSTPAFFPFLKRLISAPGYLALLIHPMGTIRQLCPGKQTTSLLFFSHNL